MHILTEVDRPAPAAPARREVAARIDAAPSCISIGRPAGNDFSFETAGVRVTDGATAVRVSTSRLYDAARAHRARLIGELIRTAVEAAASIVRKGYGRHREYRQAEALHDAFRRLGDHTLRDLGFHRSELGSMA